MAPRKSSWSSEDDNRLYQFLKDRLRPGRNHYPSICKEDWEAAVAMFPGRSVHSCKQRFGDLKALADGKIPYRTRSKIGRETPVEVSMRMQQTRPPLHTSITAFVFGDPPAGRSALDEKLRSMSA
jgi:hypothetical protein